MRSLTLSSALFLCTVLVAFAAPAAPIPLWRGGAPGEQPGPGNEKDTTTEKSNLVAGKRVARIGGITNPTIQVYSPPKGKNTGAAVVVFPGGGYSILALDLEGTEVCEWLNSIGVTGILLKYRVPPHPGAVRYAAPLQDSQRAVRLVRSHASEWGIGPARVGVLGFSAGGHLAAASSTNYETETYPAGDAADKLSPRPDFAVIIYPGYLTVKAEGDKVSPELKVTAQTPPTFLVQAEDDPVRVENSVFYFMALKNAKVPAEMHLFAAGGHGYGLRHTALPVTGWPALAERWMHTIGVLK
ncbi:MAG TPA: alpha/beta hydrolase [Bryobacteraceae bacterium]|jgi:acetyl esterase/lipase